MHTHMRTYFTFTQVAVIVKWASSVLFAKNVESLQALIDSQGKALVDLAGAKARDAKNAQKDKGVGVPILPATPTEEAVRQVSCMGRVCVRRAGTPYTYIHIDI